MRLVHNSLMAPPFVFDLCTQAGTSVSVMYRYESHITLLCIDEPDFDLRTFKPQL